MKRAPYPLAWPEGWKRTPPRHRQHPRFRGDFVLARNGILNSLRLLRAVDVVITSNLPTKSNGLPYATGRTDDPGIAVWWMQPKVGRPAAERVMACDRYPLPGENLRAIQLTIDAMRGIERWGASDLVERAFSGFAALPPSSGETIDAQPVDIDWRAFFEITPLLDGMSKYDLVGLVRGRYKRLALTLHPDHGGTREAFDELNRALELAEAEISTRDA